MSNIREILLEDLNNYIYDIMFESISDNSLLSYSEKIDSLSRLNESFIGGGLVKATEYIKSGASSIINSITLEKRKKERINDITVKYNKILQDFEVYKSNPNDKLKNDLKNRLVDLKKSISIYKSFDVKRQVSSSVTDDKVDDSSISNNNITTRINRIASGKIREPKSYSNTKDGESVGEFTTAIDDASNFIWRKHWKEKCGKLSGSSMWKCKSRGVDSAIRFIKSKKNLCNKTDNPDGCRETLNNMIERWEERKRNYLSK